MSLGPTATSIIQPYGQPCAFSSEQQVSAKTPRKTAPVSVIANGEGVIQADGLATKGVTMFGGPVTRLGNVTVVQTNCVTAVPLTPAQIVDGIVIVLQGTSATTLTLPSVTDLNQFLNSRLVTQEGVPVAAGTASFVAPRTSFHLRVLTNAILSVTMPAANPLHGGSSGYYCAVIGVGGADGSITQLAGAANQVIVHANVDYGIWADLTFVQTSQSAGGDPEWMICPNGN